MNSAQPPPSERIAVISDIHGNPTAFDAVLADIAARGIEVIINLGDVVGKGPRGSASIARSQEVCAVTVRGNWDDFLPRPHSDRDAAGEWWHDELSAADREWLLALPLSHDRTLGGRQVRFFHASATSVHVRVHSKHSDDEFDGMFANTELTGGGPEPTVVGYGDIHNAFLKTRGGRTLFNAGSVGNSLDEPTASYVILDGAEATFSAQFIRVHYDIEAEIQIARELGMPMLEEYAIELRTAIYRSRHQNVGPPDEAEKGLGALAVPVFDRGMGVDEATNRRLLDALDEA